MSAESLRSRPLLRLLSTAAATLITLGGALAADPDPVHTLTVAPGGAVSDWYLSRDKDVTATLDTVPATGSVFQAGSGAVTSSKAHHKVLWVEKIDTETKHEAVSPTIRTGGTTWVKCAGLFKVAGGGGNGNKKPPEWKSELKEKPGHIIIVHQYTGPLLKKPEREAIDKVVVAQGNWYFNHYKVDGGGRYKITVGRGGDVADYTQIKAFLATLDVSPASVITVDDLGHGAIPHYGPIRSGLPAGEDENGVMQPDTRQEVFYDLSVLISGNTKAKFPVTGEHSWGDNVVAGEVPTAGLTSDQFGNPVLAPATYVAQYASYLKIDEKVTVDLLHCFSGDKGSKTVTRLADPKHPQTSPMPSPRDDFAAALPNNVTVIGYTGLLRYPGNDAPDGTPVTE